VLAEGEFFRVGGRELIRVDVRVIAATHQDLTRLVDEGRFRADLFHRLNVVQLNLPALRDRKADLPLLVERFLADAARRLGSPVKRLQPDALLRLAAHDWPGNVRELENLCWRLAALAPNATVTRKDLDALFALPPTPPQPATAAGAHADGGSGAAGARAHDPLDAAWTGALAAAVAQALARGEHELHARLRERFDQVLLETALARSGGHRQQAARALGLGRNTVTRKLGVARPRTPP
jgi:two-component system nitrogen regulation response regulator GlnG